MAKTAVKQVSAEKARYELGRAADKMNSDDEKAQASRDRWSTWVLDAFDAGLTYGQIAEVSGKSRVRIEQVIKQQRIARGIPTNQRG